MYHSLWVVCLNFLPNLNYFASVLWLFCLVLATTLRSGGCVLMPCYPSGVIYDLFECLSGHLENLGLTQVPMYFISPVADTSLGYSNILAEWWAFTTHSFLPSYSLYFLTFSKVALECWLVMHINLQCLTVDKKSGEQLEGNIWD